MFKNAYMHEETPYIKLVLLWMIITFVSGATIFLIGFFPINNYSAEHGTGEGRPQNLDELRLKPPAQVYAQTILMLVDALRSDFPTPMSMPFSYKNSCSRLKLRVNIPTVTMPRLKSLTTGTVSNFIDIILNIGHVEQLSDSLLHRLKERNETTVFAGDRTWISLFPKQFKRSTANLDSFFVNDFFEGDKNVTEVLTNELQQTDWMLLVLHYLGLDHVGHVEGSESPKIPLKLNEMDEVVQKVSTTKSFHRQLLLLTGDHGMKDGGGHGGSTYGEMYVPLFVFKENCSTSSINSKEYHQIDVAPTLALLWSIEIPPMSIGCLIPELLSDLSFEDQLYAYYYNALHLVRKVERKFGQKYMQSSSKRKWFEHAKSAHKRFLYLKRNENFGNAFIFEDAKVHYLRVSREISEKLSDSLVRFDYGLITIGLMLTTLVVLQTLVIFYNIKEHNFINGKCTFLGVIAIAVCIYKWCYLQRYLTAIGTASNFGLLLAIVTLVYFIVNIVNFFWSNFYAGKDIRISLPSLTWALLGCLIFQTLSLASSSFIEGEEKTWHYLGTSALILLYLRSFSRDLWDNKPEMCVGSAALSKILFMKILKSRYSLLTIAGLGILARFNLVASYINQVNSKALLSCLFATGLALFSLCLRQQALVQTRKEVVAYSLAAMLIYCYRASKGRVLFVFDTSCCDNIILNIFWLIVGITTCLGLSTVIVNSKRLNGFRTRTYSTGCNNILLTSLLTISLLLHKPHNAVLVAYVIYTLSMTYELCDRLDIILRTHKLLAKVLCTIFVANMFYFYQQSVVKFSTRNNITRDFIQCFRDQPCLWNPHDPAYNDFKERRQAIIKIKDFFLNNYSLQLTEGKINSDIKRLYIFYKRCYYSCRDLNTIRKYYYERCKFLADAELDNMHLIRSNGYKKISFSVSDEFTLGFIDFCAMHPVLWDKTHPNYSVLNIRKKAYEEIAANLQHIYNVEFSHDELYYAISRLKQHFYNLQQKKILNESLTKDEQDFIARCNFLPQSDYNLQCHICERILRSNATLQTHLLKVHNIGELPHKCDYCEQRFAQRSIKREHQIRAHTKEFEWFCPYCAKGFANRRDMEMHQMVHTGERKSICEHCGKGFRLKHQMTEHVKIMHERLRRFKCTMCPKDFLRKRQLDDHIRTHLNIRDKICNICGKGFTNMHGLFRHKLLHSDVKRYECKVCGERFRLISGLSSHKKRKHKIFKQQVISTNVFIEEEEGEEENANGK
ncbi:GPI ethanolamine phosphate transferase 2 isoform X2 [Rhagoletis pomonella]|uniref:GPI ethanolamine phosphate transferase 2 isoform X2 n=2 Tax=Rhagoletis pomonella TaxID=28610 RepID=UPI00177EA66C|nr:GPI ethanolamine phosphate transferase 2 isoform X2 [Rhagoletis pomonella]